jgi:hypothetical protein
MAPHILNQVTRWTCVIRSRSGLTPEKEPPGVYQIGGRVGHRGSLDFTAKSIINFVAGN